MLCYEVLSEINPFLIFCWVLFKQVLYYTRQIKKNQGYEYIDRKFALQVEQSPTFEPRSQYYNTDPRKPENQHSQSKQSQAIEDGASENMSSSEGEMIIKKINRKSGIHYMDDEQVNNPYLIRDRKATVITDDVIGGSRYFRQGTTDYLTTEENQEESSMGGIPRQSLCSQE